MPRPGLLQQVRRTLSAFTLLDRNDRVLAAVSGGLDSLALLHVLARLHGPDRLVAACLDHALRPGSGEELHFVQAEAEKLGVSFVAGRSDVARLARRKGISIEMAGREARRRFLVREAKRAECGVIALGHHADDQAETLLLRLVRGSGLDGLAGMKPGVCMHGYRWIRPLLFSRRADLEQWMGREGHAWCEDPTNQSDEFLRNRVRYEVMPLLVQRLNPRAAEHLAELASRLQDDAAWLERAAGEALALLSDEKGRVDGRALARLPGFMHARIVHRWLSSYPGLAARITSGQVGQAVNLLCRSRGTREEDLGEGVFLRIENGTGTVAVRGGAVPAASPVKLVLPGTTRLDVFGLEAVTAMTQGPGPMVRDPGIACYPSSCRLDARLLKDGPLVFRAWKEGDRIAPLGMKGSVKLSDLFTNRKVPRLLRCRVPILVSRAGPAWVPGYGISRQWAVKSADAPSLEVLLRPLS